MDNGDLKPSLLQRKVFNTLLVGVGCKDTLDWKQFLWHFAQLKCIINIMAITRPEKRYSMEFPFGVGIIFCILVFVLVFKYFKR